MEERQSLKGTELKDILREAMEDCLADSASTATEKLVAITEAVKVYDGLFCQRRRLSPFSGTSFKTASILFRIGPKLSSRSSHASGDAGMKFGFAAAPFKSSIAAAFASDLYDMGITSLCGRL